ncbi:hypothetical protein ACTMU2_10020 [Cupriavidus basilensis]
MGSSNLRSLEPVAESRSQSRHSRRHLSSATLKDNLRDLMSRSCTEIAAVDNGHGAWWHGIATPVIFHFLRKFPAWAGWLPAHTPRLVSPEVPAAAPEPPADMAMHNVQRDGP